MTVIRRIPNKDEEKQAVVRTHAQDGVQYGVTTIRNGKNIEVWLDVRKIDGQLPRQGYASATVKLEANPSSEG